MGLAFHYSARIRDPQQLHLLTKEVADICDSLKWKYRIWEDAIEMPATIAIDKRDTSPLLLTGISFIPPESETVWLTFAPSGRIVSFMNLMAAEIYTDQTELFYTASVKTQFAGPDSHIAILSLLKYLEKKYLVDLQMMDEGHYWETLDKAVLENRFKEYWAIFDKVTNVLESATFKNINDTDSLADQIMKLLQDRLKG